MIKLIVIKTTIMLILRGGIAIQIQLLSSDECTAKVMFLKQMEIFMIPFLYDSDNVECRLVNDQEYYN